MPGRIGELEVIGEAGSVAQAMARIPALRPDVAVLDVRLPDGNGIELCRDLLSRLPDLRCLMLTSFTSEEAMLDAMLAGASGYVVKDIKSMAVNVRRFTLSGTSGSRRSVPASSTRPGSTTPGARSNALTLLVIRESLHHPPSGH